MADYSRSNGVIAAVIATGAATVAVLNGVGGDTPGTLVFGMLAILLGLQAGNELAWHGSQDRVLKPLAGVLFAVLLGGLVWAVVAFLVSR